MTLFMWELFNLFCKRKYINKKFENRGLPKGLY